MAEVRTRNTLEALIYTKKQLKETRDKLKAATAPAEIRRLKLWEAKLMRRYDGMSKFTTSYGQKAERAIRHEV